MNLKTLVRFESVLCCGHIVLYDVKADAGAEVYCVKCNTGKVVLATIKKLRKEETNATL